MKDESSLLLLLFLHTHRYLHFRGLRRKTVANLLHVVQDFIVAVILTSQSDCRFEVSLVTNTTYSF